MKKYKLKENVKNKLIIVGFYIFLILSVLVATNRTAQINEQIKSTDGYQTISTNK